MGAIPHLLNIRLYWQQERRIIVAETREARRLGRGTVPAIRRRLAAARKICRDLRARHLAMSARRDALIAQIQPREADNAA